MTKKINTPVKLNLTLRVLDKNKDNFHEIFTIFFKKMGRDELTINPQIGENVGDSIKTHGEQINGENIVARALSFARHKNGRIPPIRVTINKQHPIGSGIGAGSGNAAVVLRWLMENYDLEADVFEISKLGADVAFLAEEHDLMQGEGIGDIMTRLEDIPDYRAVLAFPLWTIETKTAYEKLDELRAEGYSVMLSAEECKDEAAAILNTLRSGRKVGLLPNDFLEIYSDERLANYQAAFDAYEKAGALAWGLCGSGSAVYALFAGDFDAKSVKQNIGNLSWVKKTAELE